MKVDLINAIIDDYYQALLAGRTPVAVDILDDNYLNLDSKWKAASDDFGTMYDAALTSKISQRYWVDKGYFPKEAILAFVEDDHDFIKSIFISLLDESKEVDGRVSRFLMSLDALLASHNKGEQKLPLHYHEDRRMVLFYLTMTSPDKYFYVTYPQLSIMLRAVKSAAPLHTLDIDRVAKFSKVLDVFINKHEKLITYINEYRSKNGIKYEGLSFWKSDMMEYAVVNLG